MTPENTAIIETIALSHRYGDRLALDGFDLTINTGDFAAILGPNGAGKSTLFRILSTLVPPQEGKATLAGCDLATATNEVRRKLGVVFQSPGLDGRLTVRENLLHFGWLYNMGGKALAERADLLLERFDVADRATDRVDTLSGGLQRRVELARALLHDPTILLLDEPTNGLDPDARKTLWRHLQSLHEDGVTIVYTTHWFEDADHASRVAILDNGKLVAWDTPSALKAQLSGEVVRISAANPAALAKTLTDAFQINVEQIGEMLVFECSDRGVIGRILQEYGDDVLSLHTGQPTLEDVYVKHTGKQLTS